MQVQKDPVVIVSAVRTPIGSFQGSLKDVSATELGSVAIEGALKRVNLSTPPQAVIMGCVLTAGLGQAPARQAALGAGLSVGTDCTTINKVCASGMKAVMIADDNLVTCNSDIVVAGGMESMTNAPYLLPHARTGYRLGHHKVLDHMYYDGLEDAYQKGSLMGSFAEKCADRYHFSREAQDLYALESLRRAKEAVEKGFFAKEIEPVVISKNNVVVTLDDGPNRANADKIPTLRPAFREGGTVTAANSSSISDGAAALVLMRLSTAHELEVEPLATIIGYSSHSQEPDWFTTAPVFAIQKLLKKINWSLEDVDLFEINEAFAVVVMAAMQELKLPRDKVNIHGGANVLGHPIGASGARLLVTLINALKTHHMKRGIASLCNGGGEATAMAIELYQE